jgi:L-glutamine:2-deoxy-scyllo-inosose/3-amino-2,3-dideoxy-scyllo-inosose aminotransferase
MSLALLGGAAVIPERLEWGSFWPPVNDESADRLLDVYRSRRWTAFHDDEGSFARAFAQHHGTEYGVFMMNGTVTMQCALGAYGIGAGDEVIVPALTWYATAMAAHYVRAKPVLVDVDPETLCIDPTKIEASITARTKAIIPVHLYGSMADMDEVLKIAARHNLRVIEDCAHMHGGIWGDKPAGSLGDVGSFSFQHSKTMAAGEGGICVTRDAAIAQRIYRMKHIGYGPGQGPDNIDKGPPPGLICYPFRATAFQAVLLHRQLQDLDARLRRYAAAVEYLETRLGASTRVRFQKPGRRAALQGRFAWVMIFDDLLYADVPIEVIQQGLVAEGVPVRRIYEPMNGFILFNLDPGDYRIDQQCSVTEAASRRAVRLLHPYLDLGKDYLDRFAEAIERVSANIDLLRKYHATRKGV